MAKRYLDEVSPKYVANYDDTYGAKYGVLPEVVVTPKGIPNVVKPKLNEKQWQRYWGDEGAASVSRGMNQVAPYVMEGLSVLGGNPIYGVAGILGSKIGEKLGYDIGGTTGGAIGGLLGGFAIPKTVNNGIRIANNIKHRNLFSYNYIEPFGYSEPFSRGKIWLKHILLDDKPPKIKDIPDVYSDHPYVFSKGSQEKYRDIAWRKYLGLPEDMNLYIKNSDGTYRYNIDLVKQLEPYKLNKNHPVLLATPTVKDFITGNGGTVAAKLEKINPEYFKYTLKDVWDLHPFAGAIDSPKLSKLASNATKYKIINKVLSNLIIPFDNKISNFEVGPILGGKPFTMKTTLGLKKYHTSKYPDYILDEGIFDKQFIE